LINPVHQLLLARIDSTPAPTVSLRDLLPHPEPLWRPFLANGVLAEADTPEEIEISPARFLNVRKVGESYFGFDTSEDYPTPQPLSREDITEYRVVISAFLTHLRGLNAVDGRTSSISTDTAGFHAIGRRGTAGDTAQVWLALALGSPDAVAAHLSLLAQEASHGRHLVVFPLWPALPFTTVSALSARGVLIADLDPSSLAIRWPVSFAAEPVPETPDFALTSKGETWRIDYLGESIDVADSIGMNYIALLMSTPDGAWSPFELQAGRLTSDAGVDDALKQGLSVRANTQADLPRASAQSVATAELTLRRFAQEIEKLRGKGRDAEADEIQEQAAQYAEQNAHLLGAGGRVKFEGDRETARLAVRNNVDRALKAISKRNERLGQILRDRVRLSPPLSFNPLKGEVWVVRFPKKIRTSRPKSRK
jgi:hypothetical protein